MDEEGRIIVFSLVIFCVGVLIFIATLIFIFRKRSTWLIWRSARSAVIVSIIVGLLGLIHWYLFGYEPLLPFVPVSIAIFYMAPAFLVAFYLGLILISPHRR